MPAFRFPSASGVPKPWRPRGRSPGWTKRFTLQRRSVNWLDKVELFPTQDQGNDCNSCTSFAMGAVMSDLWAIHTPDTAGALSPGFIHRCIGGCDCVQALDPGDAKTGLSARKVPHRQDGDYPFPEAQCSSAPGVLKLSGSSPLRTDLEAKHALSFGPIFAVMDLWDDFWRLYRGGIYRRQSGPYLASHSIEILGYDDDQSCWIMRNSRGPAWGENGGFGRIAYGECGLFTLEGNGGLQLRIR